jgi:hypothetical protein
LQRIDNTWKEIAGAVIFRAIVFGITGLQKTGFIMGSAGKETHSRLMQPEPNDLSDLGILWNLK